MTRFFTKCLGLFCLAVLCCFSLQNAAAQCGAGETEITIIINSGGSANEIGWELYDGSMTPVVSGACGAYSGMNNTDAVDTQTLCLNDGETYTFNAYDTFGDGWNGGDAEILADGCPIAILDASFQLDQAVPAESTVCIGNELEHQLTFSPDDPLLVLSGCMDPTADNYNACATTDDGSCLFNDVCASAIEIACGGSESGSTVDASVSGTDFCTISNDSPDVWYKFSATSCEEVTASLCGGGTNFDTEIAVFKGSCDDMECVGGNDQGPCGNPSELTWDAVEGEDYYIVVQGWQSNNTGDFTLDLTCSPIPPTPGCTDPAANNYDGCATSDDGSCIYPPANDLCYDAEYIGCGDVLSGTTVNANFDDVGTCETSNTAPGVWYHFIGTGADVTVDICEAPYDSKMSIFEGDCGDLICVTGEDDDCGNDPSLDFTSEKCKDYYILVHGFSSGTGTFDITLTCSEEIEVIAEGCTDPTAHNYEEAACNDDDSCETCDDGELNGDEIDVDCGGELCDPCPCGIEVDMEVAVYESGCEAGPANRVVIVTFTNGIPPVSYATDASGGSSISQKAPGVFQVIGYGPWSIEASDPSDCVQIGESDALVYVSDSDAKKESGANQNDGSATVEVTGGVPPYSVVWSNGADGHIEASGGTHENVNLSSGYYEAVVTDDEGGTAKACIYVGRDTPRGGRARGRKTADVNELNTLIAQPNPLSNSTMVRFNVPESTQATVSVFALNGKQVATVFDGQAEKGQVYNVELNASKMASGVYILRLTTDSGVVSHERIVVTK